MRQIVTSERQPIKLWLDDMEEGAMAQARNLANLPFIHSHVAIMPDAHLGYGMPIGGVMATNEVVIPNAVGVDIGCGMCAVRTSLTAISHDQLLFLLAAIRTMVPLGFKHHANKQEARLMPPAPAGVGLDDLPVVSRLYGGARTQLGTLGGGNHFIEIQKGSDGHIWIMVHTGSRNLGFQVANFYNKQAVAMNKKLSTGVVIPRQWQLAYLPLSNVLGRQYLLEMEYCVAFAQANRDLIIARIQTALRNMLPVVLFDEPINIAHNYAAREQHFGREVIVHRKGATRARKGELGIIPGSQGAPSYIVRGLGNPESFESCSHGAGRRMGRREAQRRLDLADEVEAMEKQGIIHAIRGRRDLDEAAGAYKEIARVVENQLDLIEVVVSLKPLAVIKG
ncbi:MAG: RtcB family protein [Desulfobulbaceae bacterium]|uniref:3'-phosphate/5'-hydroxy nucleic acid ligase n=1 Tax=Candidatus Desulfatifera sulfidica TaxID=2841691 RepID=A0A8J6TD68_9BACT|nr:RtcB family protein [Candidatus Desulfatifera sulfidica]